MRSPRIPIPDLLQITETLNQVRGTRFRTKEVIQPTLKIFQDAQCRG